MRFSKQRSTLIMETRVFRILFQIIFLSALGISLSARVFFGWVPTISSVEELCSHSLIVCPFHYFTGWHCPGCGMTRALVSFFAGDPVLSFYFHPLGPVLGYFFVYLFYKSLCKTTVNFDAIIYGKRSWVSLVVLVVWGFMRNLMLS